VQLSLLATGICALYVLTMPTLLSPDTDAIRWARWVEQPDPVWEGRHLLAWPVERSVYRVCYLVGYRGRAFIPAQVLHAVLAAAAISGLVWLLLRRGATGLVALSTGITIALTATWFNHARGGHIRAPGPSLGLLCIAGALGASEPSVRLKRVQAGLAVLGAVSVLLQIDCVAYLLVATAVVGVRQAGSVPRRLQVVGAIGLGALLLVTATYVGLWTAAVGRSGDYRSPAEWVLEHPEAQTLDSGLSPRQLLRVGAGLLRAECGGETAIKAIKGSLTKQAGTSGPVGAYDWIALSLGGAVLVSGLAMALAGLRRPDTRLDAAAITAVSALFAAFGLRWTGSDDWVWLGVMALLWYGIARYLSHRLHSTVVAAALMVVVILEAVGAYRGVQAPSVLIKKAAPEVRMAMAYGRLSDPEDLLMSLSHP
jgi:hypothetical protein